MKVLLTAFDPFGQEEINPALEAVKLVPDKLKGIDIIKLEVPTVFGLSIERVTAAMDREKPDVVLCIGQAGGRFEVTPERVAINLNDAPIADNQGNQPLDQPIVKEGANAYFSNLPLKAMVAAIRQGGVPSGLSNSAGTFVCNHLMYGVLHHIHQNNLPIRGGFIHVPFIPAQVVNRPSPSPSLSVELITRGLVAAIVAIEANKADCLSPEGANH